jgi:hypothetical protein
MLFKQDGQIKESGAFYQRLVSRFHSRTHHRIEHPRGHAAGRPISKAHVNYVPLAASRTEGLTVLPEKRMVWIEDFRKQTDTRIVERVSSRVPTGPSHPSEGA